MDFEFFGEKSPFPIFDRFAKKIFRTFWAQKQSSKLLIEQNSVFEKK